MRRLSLALSAGIVGVFVMNGVAAASVPSPVLAWGENGSGELGDGTNSGPEMCTFSYSGNVPCSKTPVSVSIPSGVTVTAISAGEAHSLALLSNGTVLAWGVNRFGQLGDGYENYTPNDLPVAVCAIGETAPCAHDLEGVKAVSAGGEHSLALLDDGTVVAWGENRWGELGDGAEGYATDSDVPVPVCARGQTAPCGSRLSGVKAIAAGQYQGLALLENGEVRSWGENTYGALGDGVEGPGSDVPVAVCGKGETAPCETYLSGITAIAAGTDEQEVNGQFAHSLALKENGEVRTWGSGGDGQLGDGKTTNSDAPVGVCATGETTPCSKFLSGVTAIAAGEMDSMALLGSKEEVRTWGSGSFGDLGDGEAGGTKAVPVAVCQTGEVAPCHHSLNSVVAISGGGLQSLALLTYGQVRAWGGNDLNVLGDGTSNGGKGVVVSVCSKGGTAPCHYNLGGVTAVSAGGNHDLVIVNVGPIYWKTQYGGYAALSAKSKVPFKQSGGSSVLEGSAVFEGARTIECRAASGTGDIVGPNRTTKLKITYTGCEIPELKESCQTKASRVGVISTNALDGELTYASEELGGAEKVANRLTAEKTGEQIAKFTCGAEKEDVGAKKVEHPVEVTGTILEAVAPASLYPEEGMASESGETVALVKSGEPTEGCGNQQLLFTDGEGECQHLLTNGRPSWKMSQETIVYSQPVEVGG